MNDINDMRAALRGGYCLSAIRVNAESTFDEPARNLAGFSRLGQESTAKIIAEAIRLMHAFVQHCDDPDVAAGEAPPIVEVMPIPEAEALDAKLDRDRPRWHAVALNSVESGEQVGDIPLSLLRVKAIPIEKPPCS